MMSSFDSRSIIQQGTPQKLQECFRTKPPSEAELAQLMIMCFNKRKNEFANFLPVFIKSGASVNTLESENSKKTILMAACATPGCVDIVDKMIECGADLSIKDAQNRNALFYSMDNSKQESAIILKKLLQHAPHLVTSEASNRKTLLIYAIQKLNKQVVRILLDNGVNTNVCLEDTQQSPLHIAVKKNRKKTNDPAVISAIITLLMERKVNPLLRTKQGKTAMDLDEDSKKLIEDLISQQSQNQERKKPKSSSYQENCRDLKIYNNVLKMGNKQIGPMVKLNDKNDQIAVHRQAAAIFDGHLQEKEQKYEEERRREEKKRQQEREIREQEQRRSEEPIIPPNELCYYLQEEIKLFVEQIKEENSQNKKTFDELIALISEKIEGPLNIKLKIYGSFATQLCLKESDIDVVVVPNNRDDYNNLEILEKIDDILKTLDFVSDTKFIKTAVIPVLKVACSELYKNKKIDITIQDENHHSGLKCLSIIKKYMDYYEELSPLAFVLKTFIYSSNLYDTYQGGLNSYGLILMIVAFLQRQYRYKKQGTKLMVAELLFKFLNFFGYEFDYVNKQIYVDSPDDMTTHSNDAFYCVSDHMYLNPSPRLILLDPLNASNNVGRSTHQIRLIQMAFCFATTFIQYNYSCRDPSCKYRQRINEVVLPKEFQEKKRPRPCCILRRMFECAKQNI